jgi:hypothetical protein
MPSISFRRFLSSSLALAFAIHTCRAHGATSPTTLTTTALDRSSSGWFAASACTATAEGHQTTRSGSSISRTAPHPAAWSSTSSLLQRSCSHPCAEPGPAGDTSRAPRRIDAVLSGVNSGGLMDRRKRGPLGGVQYRCSTYAASRRGLPQSVAYPAADVALVRARAPAASSVPAASPALPLARESTRSRPARPHRHQNARGAASCRDAVRAGADWCARISAVGKPAADGASACLPRRLRAFA